MNHRVENNFFFILFLKKRNKVVCRFCYLFSIDIHLFDNRTLDDNNIHDVRFKRIKGEKNKDEFDIKKIDIKNKNIRKIEKK